MSGDQEAQYLAEVQTPGTESVPSPDANKDHMMVRRSLSATERAEMKRL